MKQKKRSFLFDRMLGKLCVKMRLVGYDAALNPEGESGRFLLNAAKEGRCAVTRARNMGDRPGPKPVILISDDVNEQIVELFAATGDTPGFEPFTRCLECNALLIEEPEEAVKGEVPPHVEKSFHRFHRCPSCRRIYWEGSHFQAMSKEIKEIAAKLKRR
ncbi:MAG: Mut7-C RNAse domain-containing protein [Candidatus Krumholzibacteria bacterium]|nr:Mut7-C RNAse domain-containing protein [Candidatus Krumholzibacteria bacterium]